MKVFKKILLGIIIFIVVIIAIVGIAIAVNAPANLKAMNKSVETYIDTVSKYYTLTEVECGEYENLKLFGMMKFDVKQYDVESVGNLAVMTTNIGVMQMATVVLTPTDCDMPLISMDYMYMLGSRTAYLEIYDLVLEQDEDYKEMLSDLGAIRESYSGLETVTPSEAWYDSLKTEGFYKKGTKADDDALIEMLEKGLERVMVYGQSLSEISGEERTQKVKLQKTYSDGLIDNGGISTDIFVKALGTDETRKFFDSVLFKAE